MFDWIFDPQIWASLLTLTALEVVLGIDNIIFISIVSSRLPDDQALRARQLGLGGALVMRILFLASIAWIIGLTAPIAEVFGFALSWRDLVMLAGGLFLLAKGTIEIHHTVEGESHGNGTGGSTSFSAAVTQILILDVVFSIDSVITAVGMARHLPVMIAAVVIAIVIMLWASGPVSKFVDRHPTTKMLALSFLLLVGVALIADGLHFHIPRGYLYFAITFSILVESLNLLAARRRTSQNLA
jgi:predicted tellurium resistance membrane protein TerC